MNWGVREQRRSRESVPGKDSACVSKEQLEDPNVTGAIKGENWKQQVRSKTRQSRVLLAMVKISFHSASEATGWF